MAWNIPCAPVTVAAAVALLIGLTAAQPAARAQEPAKRHTSLSLLGVAKKAGGFKHFDWVNPDAPKAGRVRLWAMGTFDSFNPYSVQGNIGGRPDLIQGTLMASAGADEESTVYAHIAEWASYPEDYSSVTFGLNKEARFSDGSPITADDVIFSLGALKSAHPDSNSYYLNVVSAEKSGDNEVTFKFNTKGNRELPVIVAEMPVLSKAFWTGKNASGEPRDITKSTLEPPVGAGPYRVKEFEAGRSITYTRIENWWAKDTPAMKGQWNFDEVRIEYFKDRTAAFEGFKSGGIDYWPENVAKEWATAYEFAAVKRGDVKMDKVPRGGVSSMQSFAFNLRRPQFQDVRVRKAFNLAFNFEAVNKQIFYDQYVRLDSYFANSELQSKGLPQGKELALLEEVRAQVPPEVFTSEYKNAEYKVQADERRHLSAASKLLAEAGWTAKDGQLTNAAGQTLTAEFLFVSPDNERFIGPYKKALDKLGVVTTLRVVDPSQFQRRRDTFDFDIILASFPQSLSPGNEQRSFWGSQSASRQGSRNYIGIQNPAVDTLIDKIIMAPSREDLVAATRALDRVLLWNYYVVPQWSFPFERIAYWDKFKRPDTLPSRGAYFLQTWWFDPQAAQRIGTR